MIELIHLSLPALGAVMLAVVVGALVQGAIGFGLNLVVVPVVAVLEPAALPASMIIMALPMTAGSALREREHIDRSGVLWTTLGRLPGVVAGAWLVTALAAETLALVIGGCVVLAASMSALTPPPRVRPVSAAIAGLVGGLMGTASSIGGPPVALLYQGQPGPVLRSTLGAAFLIGTVLSLGALALAGAVATWHVWLGVSLMPCVALGLYASRWLLRWIDAGWLRPCVIAFACLSGLGVLLRGLV